MDIEPKMQNDIVLPLQYLLFQWLETHGGYKQRNCCPVSPFSLIPSKYRWNKGGSFWKNKGTWTALNKLTGAGNVKTLRIKNSNRIWQHTPSNTGSLIWRAFECCCTRYYQISFGQYNKRLFWSNFQSRLNAFIVEHYFHKPCKSVFLFEFSVVFQT